MTIDNQRAVSELLRSADKSIKDGNLDSALASISKVFDFDQRNVYARAYQERILSLKEIQNATKAIAEKVPTEGAHKIQDSGSSQPKHVPPSVPKEPETAHPSPAPAAGQPGALKQAPYAPPVVAPLPETAPEHGRTLSAQPVQQATTPSVPVIQEASPAAASSRLFDNVKYTPARLEAYKTLLADIWALGTFTPVEEQRVAAIRHLFNITDDEHAIIERDIRIAAYLATIEQAWKNGVTSFDGIRKQYRISDQEHLQIEGRVFRLLQSLRSIGTAMLIDDDLDFLQLASRQLTEAGYYCVAVPTCEEALFVLESVSPNVVVCDINFSKPNMSGFAFYEKFRTIEKFFHVPFIFLSGMEQESIQRTGMQKGADSYFTKPIDLELFLATIEGKIKRSYELRQRLSLNRP